MILRPWQWAAVALGMAGSLVALWPRTPELAEVQLRAGDAGPAIRLLESAVRHQPQDLKLRTELIDAYERAGRVGEALAAIESLAAQAPLAPLMRERGRRLALSIGQPARALALLAPGAAQADAQELKELVDLALMASDLVAARRFQQRLLDRSPHDPAALARTRDLALAGRDLGAAIAAQRRLAAAAPSPAARERLVDLLVQAGRTAEALEALEAAQPQGDARPWHRRAAQLAEWAGAPARALPHLEALYAAEREIAIGRRLLAAQAKRPPAERLPLAERLVADHPQDAGLRRTLFELRVAAGRLDQALAMAQAEVRAHPDDAAASRALVSLGLGHNRRGVAIEELERWTRRHPQDWEARLLQAQALVWDNRLDQAWQAYARLVADRAPGAVPRAWREAWLAISAPLHDYTEPGAANLEALVASTPEQLEWRRRLAHARLERGERDQAIAALKQVVADPRSRAEDATTLASWLFWSRRPAEAAAVLEAAEARRPLAATALIDAGYQAASLERWAEAARFLSLAAARQPRRPETWIALARAREQHHDLAGALEAWRRRVALGGTTPADRLYAAGLAIRLSRKEQALGLLATGPGAATEEWRTRAVLARELGREAEEAAALRVVVARAPRDIEAVMSLAELRQRAGASAEAEALENRALAAEPHNSALLIRVAARRFYGPSPERADALIARLAALPELASEGLRLLADYYQTRDPQRAAAALDRLIAKGEADAPAWLRRGELHLAAGEDTQAQSAWERALALAGSAPATTPLQETRALALENLGHLEAATQAWEAVAAAEPTRWGPLLSLGRLALRRQDTQTAGRYLEKAERLAPAAFETRALKADWLLASDRPAEAVALLTALRRERPELTSLSVAEASARHGLGQFRQARDLARAVLAAHPHDAGLQGFYQGLRDDGTSRLAPFARYEQSSLLSQREAGLAASVRLGDRFRLTTEAAQLDWGEGLAGQQVAVGISGQSGPFQAEGRVTAANQQGAGVRPFARAQVAYERGALSARAGLAEQRWDESRQAIAGLGRERRGEWQAAYRLWDDRLTLGASGALGQLVLGDQPLGGSSLLVGEAAWRPWAGSPWVLAYQYRHRGWGAAGALAGLPEAVDFHVATVDWAVKRGPWHLELQPGYGLDARTGAGAPSLAGALGYQLGPDAELSLQGTWSGRAFSQGSAGSYQRVELMGRYYF